MFPGHVQTYPPCSVPPHRCIRGISHLTWPGRTQNFQLPFQAYSFIRSLSANSIIIPLISQAISLGIILLLSLTPHCSSPHLILKSSHLYLQNILLISPLSLHLCYNCPPTLPPSFALNTAVAFNWPPSSFSPLL